MTTPTPPIPKFNFTGASVRTEAEMAAEEAKIGGGGDKYLKPGRHEVTVTAAVYKGLAKDPNWGKFELTLTGTGEKTIRAFLTVPFRDVMYMSAAGKPTAFMYKKFKSFLEGLGVSVTVDTLGDVLPQYFGNNGAGLIGMTTAIEVGYDGNYVKYAGKSDTGEKKYNIVFGDGSILLDKQLQVVNFPDYASAGNYAEANQIKLQKFPDILSYSPSARGNVAAAVGNW
jgi:hypothetical protein